MKKKTIVLYSHDGFGLGHLKRNLNIALRGLSEIEDASFVLLTGSSNIPIARCRSGLDIIKLPSIHKVATGQWLPRSLSVEMNALVSLRSSIIYETIYYLNPDVFIVDYMPTGVMHELLPVLKLLRSRAHPCKVVLGLRDILDNPDVTRALWHADNSFQVMKEFYDRILIYGKRSLYATATRYGFSPSLKQKTRYCGYVSGYASDRIHHFAQRTQGVPHNGKKHILVTAGGGADAYPMMMLVMKALKKLLLESSIPMQALFITGPLMNPEQFDVLDLEAQNVSIAVKKSGDVEQRMRHADLIVSMAGYNTLMDALSLGKKVLVIPREGPSAEQSMRTEIFAKKGYVEGLLPVSHLSVDDVATAIRAMLLEEKRYKQLKIDGLQTVIAEIKELFAGADGSKSCSVSPVMYQ